MLEIMLEKADGAAMVMVKGKVDSRSVADFADAIGVLDAEAVVVVNLLACTELDPRAMGSLVLLNRMRNGRFIIVAQPGSQPALAVHADAPGLQLLASLHDATVCAESMERTAYNTFSNQA